MKPAGRRVAFSSALSSSWWSAGRGRLDHPRSRRRWHSRRVRRWRWPIITAPIPPAFRRRLPRQPGRARRVSRARRRIAWSATPTQGGQPYAGGLGFKLPFGTLYSTNITPDKETGIGNYSDQDFLAAVHRGIRRDGAQLYPAMPFTSYTYMTDADALAIKAYLFSLPPVHAPPRRQYADAFRSTSAGRWASGRRCSIRIAASSPTPSKSPEWNRGAYLAEALAHCGECHTPRNLAFALDNRKKFAGALTAGWRAFNISSDKATGVGAWSDEDLVSYLSIGHATATAPRRARWAKRWTTASASWRRKTSARWWPICAACPRSLRPICRRRWRRRRRPRTRTAAGRRTRAARWCSKAPASVATAGPAKVRSRPMPR